MRLGVRALIRCCDVGVCPALSAGSLASVLHPRSLPFASFTSLLQLGCATRAGASAARVQALFVGLSIDMTCSNAQFSVLHRLVASAFEHAACRCDIH
jgi:predicted exporter